MKRIKRPKNSVERIVDKDQDIDCIEKVVAGDRNAFAFLVDRYKDMVFSVALRMARNTEEAEEIAQDAFVKAFLSLASFRGKARFSTWLYRIVPPNLSGLRAHHPKKPCRFSLLPLQSGMHG